jgi:hypothetical protein
MRPGTHVPLPVEYMFTCTRSTWHASWAASARQGRRERNGRRGRWVQRRRNDGGHNRNAERGGNEGGSERSGVHVGGSGQRCRCRPRPHPKPHPHPSCLHLTVAVAAAGAASITSHHHPPTPLPPPPSSRPPALPPSLGCTGKSAAAARVAGLKMREPLAVVVEVDASASGRHRWSVHKREAHAWW